MATAEVVHPDPEGWDEFVHSRGGHFLQSARWGELKRATGRWDYEIVALAAGGSLVCGALVLYLRAPLPVTVAYVPRGPVIDWGDEALAKTMLAALDAASRRRRALLLKIEPDMGDSRGLRCSLRRLGLKSSAHDIQPRNTILVDTEDTEEGVFARVGQGTRRKIRTAARRGVEVRRGDVRDIGSFYGLMRITGRRDRIAIRTREYYRATLELFAPDRGALLLASHDGRDLGGLIAIAMGRRAWYLYGASSSRERDRMPNYALQWEAIRWARERGCVEYDLWGIPDADESTLEAQFPHRRDGMWGLYGFKRGFGGRVWRTVGAWDRPYHPLLHALYGVASRCARRTREAASRLQRPRR